MAITVRELNEKEGIKGWTARGVWENAEDGDAFVDEDGFVYVVNEMGGDRIGERVVVVFDPFDGAMWVYDENNFHQNGFCEILHPVDLDIRWTRK